MLRHPATAVLTLGLFLLAGGLLAQQTPKPGDDKTPPGKLRGVLRPNWGKIGLSDGQKQQIYKVQGDYRAKIEALEEKIRELKKQQEIDEFKVLTEAQRGRLKEILGGKVPDLPSDTAKKDANKPSTPKQP